MATDQELRVVLRTIGDARGAEQVRTAISGVRKEAERPASGGGFLKNVGLGGEDLLRGGLALVGLSAGLNIAASAATALHKAIGGSTAATIDAAQTVRATTAAYGANAGAFVDFADKLGAATGNTRESILKAALSARTLSDNYGLSIEQTQRLITVSADLAKVRGIGVAEAFERVQSAIRGEAEASEYLGLTLNATFLKNNALNGSLRNTYETLTDAQRAQVVYGEVLRQSAAFSGLAADANKGLEGSLNRLNLQGAELAKTFGATVGPTVQWVADRLTEAAKSADLLLKIGKVAQAQSVTRAAAIDQAEREIPLPTGIIGASQEGIDRHAKVVARAEEIYAASVGKATQEALGQVEATRKSVAEFDALERATIKASNAADQLAHNNAVKAAQAGAEARIVSLQRDQEAAGRENLDRTIQEAQARGGMVPIQRELAEVDARIFDLTDKRVALLREEQLVRARINANPANDALQDLQTQEQRLRLLATIRGPQRGDARRELRTLIRSGAIPRAELGALDANAGVTAAERAQRDAALKEQLALGPIQRERAEIEQRLSVRQREVQEIGFLQAADKARSDEAIANIQKEVRAVMDAKQTVDDFLSGRNTFSTDRAAAFDLGAGPIKGPGFAKLGPPPPVTVTATFNVTQQPGESSDDFGQRILNDLAGTLAVAMTTAVGQGAVPAGTPGGTR